MNRSAASALPTSSRSIASSRDAAFTISPFSQRQMKRHGLLLELRHSAVSLQRMLYHLGMAKRLASSVDPRLAKEAKSIVAQCFRNGPIEDLHAGIKCPTCSGDEKYSHITQREMKRIIAHHEECGGQGLHSALAERTLPRQVPSLHRVWCTPRKPMG